MAESIQIIGAVLGLAKHAGEICHQVQKLMRARREAKGLYDRIKQLHEFSNIVANVLENRVQDPGVDDFTKATMGQAIDLIWSSIDGCDEALNTISKTIKPLLEKTDDAGLQKIKFVWSDDLVSKQKDLINTNLQLLGFNLQLLQSLDQAKAMRDQADFRVEVRAMFQYSQHLLGAASSDKRSVIGAEDSRLKQFETASQEDIASASASTTTSKDSVLSSETAAHKDEELSVTVPSYLRSSRAFLGVPVRRKEPEAVQALVAAGLDRTKKDDDKDVEGWTNFHHASTYLDAALLKSLFMRPGLPDSFVNEQTKRGETALMFAATQADLQGSAEVAQILIDNGADVNILNVAKGADTDRDALYYALDKPKTKYTVKFIELLVENGVDTTYAVGRLSQKARGYDCLKQSREPDSPTLVDQDSDRDLSRPLTAAQNAQERLAPISTRSTEVADERNDSPTASDAEKHPRRETILDALKRKVSKAD